MGSMEVVAERRGKTASSATENKGHSPSTRLAKVVICSSTKGGTAKSTTTRCLASFAARQGYRTAIIDLDRQQTVTAWWLRRPDSLPSITNYDGIPMREAGVAIREIAASGEYDVIFVDTAPGSADVEPVAAIEDKISPSLKALIRRANLVLIPTTDGGEDIESVSKWAAEVHREGTLAYFLLCIVDRASATLREAKQALMRKGAVSGTDLCAIEVRRNTKIKRSYNDGRGPADWSGPLGEKAAEDYAAVWDFVKRKIELGG
jgi:chromosome partitioning protein